MKKFLLFSIFLLNLLPNMNIRTGSISIGWSTLSAQQMGNEIAYYCHDDEIGWYNSPIPCDEEVCHQACIIGDCPWEGDCDAYDFHVQVEHSNYDNDNEQDNSNDSSNNGGYEGGSGGGGGSGGTSPSGGSNSGNGNGNSSSNSWSGVDKAIATLNANASTPENLKYQSKRECAKYVRLALEAGGIDTSEHPKYAKDYGPYLEKWGFHEISRTNYIPQKGDIKVWQNHIGGHIAGHINMYNGKDWVSDFFENPNGPGPQYRKYNNYKIYRK